MDGCYVGWILGPASLLDSLGIRHYPAHSGLSPDALLIKTSTTQRDALIGSGLSQHLLPLERGLMSDVVNLSQLPDHSESTLQAIAYYLMYGMAKAWSEGKHGNELALCLQPELKLVQLELERRQVQPLVPLAA